MVFGMIISRAKPLIIGGFKKANDIIALKFISLETLLEISMPKHGVY